MRGARDDELRARHSPGDLDGRGAQHRGQAGQLVRPAAWQQRHDRTGRIEAEFAGEREPVRPRCRQLEQRMAHEAHVHALRAIQRLLEREDHQHPIDQRLHRLHAARAPRPQLRADVVDDRDAQRLDGAHQPEVEIGIVDEDQHVGPLFARGRHELLIGGPGSRQHLQRLGEAGDREPPEVGDQPRARAGELFAAEPERLEFRVASPQRFDERAGIEVAGRLAARNHDPHCFFKSAERMSSWSMGMRSNASNPAPFRLPTNCSAFPTRTTDS